MDDASRVTWSGVFFTLGSALAVGFTVRWARWQDTGGYGQAPQVLWTLGFLSLGLLLVALQLRVPIWLRTRTDDQREEKKSDASGDYWGGE